MKRPDADHMKADSAPITLMNGENMVLHHNSDVNVCCELDVPIAELKTSQVEHSRSTFLPWIEEKVNCQTAVCDQPAVRKLKEDAGVSLEAQSTSPDVQKCHNSEMLDVNRQEQQLMQFQADVDAVASWIGGVTGHAISRETSTGLEELQLALVSGEVLCDFVNAIWPGRIGGILRGKLNPFQRLDNITRFIQACRDIGVEEVRLFAVSDLLEGKNLKAVVLCVLALADLIPDSPNYDGARLQGSYSSKRISTITSIQKMSEADASATQPATRKKVSAASVPVVGKVASLRTFFMPNREKDNNTPTPNTPPPNKQMSLPDIGPKPEKFSERSLPSISSLWLDSLKPTFSRGTSESSQSPFPSCTPSSTFRDMPALSSTVPDTIQPERICLESLQPDQWKLALRRRRPLNTTAAPHGA